MQNNLLSPWGYLVMVLLTVGFAWARRADPNDGGYKDSYKTVDKVGHVVISFLLAFASGLVMSVGPAFVITLLAGLGWEGQQWRPMKDTHGRTFPFAQGKGSTADLVANLVGAIAGILQAYAIRELTGWQPGGHGWGQW